MVLPVFLTCGPNEVLVVSGFGYRRPALITGGRVIAFTCFQTWRRLSLNVMTIVVDSPGVYTVQGVPVKVTGIAQVKISNQHPDILELACEHFLEKNTNELRSLITSTLEGHQRCIMGTMTIKDIYKNRKLFNSRVFEVASKELCNLGLQLLSYTIKDLKDDLGYLDSLGKARTSQVQRDARIGECYASRDAQIKSVLANEELMAAKYTNESLKAEAERNYRLQKASFDREVMTKKAEADLAYELQANKTKQRIAEELMETKVVEKKAQIKLQDQEILRRQKHSTAAIRHPADAEKFRLETISAAERQQTILEAEAEAEANRLIGEAEAFVIEEKAKAVTSKMKRIAEARKGYGEAAVLQMYLKAIPKLVAEVATPLANAASVKMVSSADSEIGAAKLTKEVIDISSNIPSLVKNMTGVDLKPIRNAETGWFTKNT